MHPLLMLLRHANLITHQQAEKAATLCDKKHLSPYQALKTLHIYSYDKLIAHISQLLHLPIANIEDYDYPSLCQELQLKEPIVHYQALPVAKVDQELILAVTDPTDQQLQNDFQFSTGLNVQLVLSRHDHIQAAIQALYGDSVKPQQQAQTEQVLSSLVAENEQLEQEELTNNQSPVSHVVDQILCAAIDHQASDIHFEPYQNTYRIRFRCDGLLLEHQHLPVTLHRRFAARLKIMAQLDIAQKRLPQDGRIHYTHHPSEAVDIRVSLIPTQWGEKIVLRLLPAQRPIAFERLGLTSLQYTQFQHALHQPQGFILVTGPTGSGKTQTLYSALMDINHPTLNISSVEDPIEISLPNINQIAINHKINLDFAMVLRSLLRQDPDVILIGEIRDKETADIAINAAQTGHLVLATLHTNSTTEAIQRLQQMGLASYLIGSSLQLIVAQRLVRRLCTECRRRYTPTQHERDILGINDQQPIYCANEVGCHACHYGYKGRIAIFELLPVDDELNEAIYQQKSARDLANIASQTGMVSLLQSAVHQVILGETSLQECQRVLVMAQGSML
ncbi:GspE/PulE family protein [Vibrio palustris]|uniref:Type II secretion system protein E n=1 Tax=Vibrio palustris TaxID=1918946 RepID=A0A1R4B8Z6_9VIBR|nr:ATPase, T2SS/T4P/T4SS family [Vibrio palustris]SJL85369.1 Type II secretion system protein E [Vibrio palustris]